MGDTDRKDIRKFLVNEGISSPNNALINQVRNAGSENEIRRIIAAVKPTTPASAAASQPASPAAAASSSPASAASSSSASVPETAAPTSTKKLISVERIEGTNGKDATFIAKEVVEEASSMSGLNKTPKGKAASQNMLRTGQEVESNQKTSGGRRKRSHRKRSHKRTHKRSHKTHKRHKSHKRIHR